MTFAIRYNSNEDENSALESEDTEDAESVDSRRKYPPPGVGGPVLLKPALDWPEFAQTRPIAFKNADSEQGLYVETRLRSMAIPGTVLLDVNPSLKPRRTMGSVCQGLSGQAACWAMCSIRFKIGL